MHAVKLCIVGVSVGVPGEHVLTVGRRRPAEVGVHGERGVPAFERLVGDPGPTPTRLRLREAAQIEVDVDQLLSAPRLQPVATLGHDEVLRRPVALRRCGRRRQQAEQLERELLDRGELVAPRLPPAHWVARRLVCPDVGLPGIVEGGAQQTEVVNERRALRGHTVQPLQPVAQHRRWRLAHLGVPRVEREGDEVDRVVEELEATGEDGRKLVNAPPPA